MTKGKRQNSYTEWKTIGSCSRWDACSFLHTHATGDRETLRKEVGDARRSRQEQASSSMPKVKEQTDVKSSNSLEASPATGAKKTLVYERQDEKDHREIIGIIPCVVVTSLETDAFVAPIAYFDMLMVRRNRERARERKVLKEQLLFWGKKRSKVVYLKTQIQWILFFRKAREIGLNASAGHTMKFSGCTWYETKNSERKGQSGGSIQKGEPHERNPCASSFEERTLEETSRQEDCDHKAAWNLARKTHMLSKRDLSSDRMDTLRRRSRNPMTVLTATGKVQINEDAQVFVRDLDLFVTVRFLDETPVVLLLGTLCSRHGYPFEWKNCETPRLVQNWKTITCIMDNFVTLVVPGLSSYSSNSLSSTSRSTDQSKYSSKLETLSDPRETVNQHTKKF